MARKGPGKAPRFTVGKLNQMLQQSKKAYSNKMKQMNQAQERFQIALDKYQLNPTETNRNRVKRELLQGGKFSAQASVNKQAALKFEQLYNYLKANKHLDKDTISRRIAGASLKANTIRADLEDTFSALGASKMDLALKNLKELHEVEAFQLAKQLRTMGLRSSDQLDALITSESELSNWMANLVTGMKKKGTYSELLDYLAEQGMTQSEIFYFADTLGWGIGEEEYREITNDPVRFFKGVVKKFKSKEFAQARAIIHQEVHGYIFIADD